MKLNTSLLAAIALGVSLGAVTTSCKKLEVNPQDNHIHQHNEDCPDECTTGNITEEPGNDPYFDCPMCGLG